MWDRRAKRARLLADRYPASGEILVFYAGLADWQGEVAGHAADLDALRGDLPSLLDLVRRTGPPPLAAASGSLRAADFDRLIGRCWHEPEDEDEGFDPLEFFARALLQPHAATYPAGLDCPWCARPPQAGLLRPQGDGLAFEVICGLCLRSRRSPRGRCPGCRETSKDKLASFTTPDFPHLRLKACDACRSYLVVVDRSRDPNAIPEVDELAAGPLDLWAVEQGYHKLQPNIAGL